MPVTSRVYLPKASQSERVLVVIHDNLTLIFFLNKIFSKYTIQGGLKKISRPTKWYIEPPCNC